MKIACWKTTGSGAGSPAAHAAGDKYAWCNYSLNTLANAEKYSIITNKINYTSPNNKGNDPTTANQKSIAALLTEANASKSTWSTAHDNYKASS